MCFYGEGLLAPRPTPKLEDHPSSAVRGCLFNLFTGGGYGEGLSGSINAGNFLTSYKVYWLASQEGLCSME